MELQGDLALDGTITSGGSPVLTHSSATGYLSTSFMPSNPSAIQGNGATLGGGALISMGNGATATGTNSAAIGNGALAITTGSVALGSNTDTASWSSTGNWVETDPIFLLGNGESNVSNAITTLKNGQTTLTNKAWKSATDIAPATALDDPASTTTDSGGEALVVEGHTRLKGKVIIEQAQGDISMGIYQ
ncbi:MAG: hypothetical protein ACSHX7_00595 [Luteolibacter sp.]